MQGDEMSLRTILLGPQRAKVTADLAGRRKTRLTSPLGVYLQGLRLACWMKALTALAHRPAGLALRENVLYLGFAAREIAIGWFP
jgi:hypothetical protein